MWLAAAFLAVALLLVLYRPSDPNSASAFDRFTLNFVPKSAPQPSIALAAVPVAPSALPPTPHSTAPHPDTLANDVATQARYDAEAKPGDFVTPPSVSIAH